MSEDDDELSTLIQGVLLVVSLDDLCRMENLSGSIFHLRE